MWFGPRAGEGVGGWWLFELEIEEAYRGGGVARDVLALVDLEVRDRGGRTIGLIVFDHNIRARALSERTGYRAISTLMRKTV